MNRIIVSIPANRLFPEAPEEVRPSFCMKMNSPNIPKMMEGVEEAAFIRDSEYFLNLPFLAYSER